MICEKCGKSNKAESRVCAYCKAQISPKSSCGGFADILSFENAPKADTRSAMPANNTGSQAESNKKPLTKIQSVIAVCEKYSILSIAAIFLCVIMIILCIVSGCSNSARQKLNAESLKAIDEKIESLDERVDRLDKLNMGSDNESANDNESDNHNVVHDSNAEKTPLDQSIDKDNVREEK